MGFPMKTFSSVLLCLFLTGCGTWHNVVRTEENVAGEMVSIPGPKTVYGGVERDIEVASDWLSLSPAWQVAAIPILAYYTLIDLPLSAVGDTITLPLTVAESLDD